MNNIKRIWIKLKRTKLKKQHVHDLKLVCHCRQMMCTCGDHLDKMIREAKVNPNTLMTSEGEMILKFKDGLNSESELKEHCRIGGYRFG